MLHDFLNLVMTGLAMEWEQRPAQLAAFCVGGLCGAVACFFLCSFFARLWNRRIQLTRSHRAWCAFAALVCVILVVMMAGVLRLGDAARLRISDWSALFSDEHSSASLRLWDAEGRTLQAAGFPQSAQFPQVHTYDPEGRAIKLGATAMSTEALQIFGESNPLLHHLIQGRTDGAVAAVSNNTEQFFHDHPGEERRFSDSLPILRHEMELGLIDSVPAFQRQALVAAMILLVIAQCIPILLTGFSAYGQIAVTPRGRSSVGRRRAPPRLPNRS